ncbi:unnamed protein product [Symbiodinium sp. KB8]|nr:unnamed protein product [Symbiodinium sp. KB8]
MASSSQREVGPDTEVKHPVDVWGTQQLKQYQALHRLAHEAWLVPLSSTSVERCFSTVTALFMDVRRNRAAARRINCHVILRSNRDLVQGMVAATMHAASVAPMPSRSHFVSPGASSGKLKQRGEKRTRETLDEYVFTPQVAADGSAPAWHSPLPSIAADRDEPRAPNPRRRRTDSAEDSDEE